MNLDWNKRRAIFAVVVTALFVLCATLGYLQYRWIGEISEVARERLRGTLEANLGRASQDFNSELTAACLALLPPSPPSSVEEAETEVGEQYEQARRSGARTQIFGRVGLAIPRNEALVLRTLDLQTGTFVSAEWPAEWSEARTRLELVQRRREGGHERRGPGPPDQVLIVGGPARPVDAPFLVELPLFDTADGDAGRARGGHAMGMPGPGAPHPRAAAWLILEPNIPYIRANVLPELIQHDLGRDYQAEVRSKAAARAVIYQSDTSQPGRSIVERADGSASLGELQYERIFRHWRMGGAGDRGPGRGPGSDQARPRRRAGERGPGREALERRGRPYYAAGMLPDGRGARMLVAGGFGRWEIFVRHRAGSLEAVVNRTRWFNLALAGAVLLLMVASVVALIRFTRRAQKLAELQMDFVAGVSHELRTPLTVIHTAAYNLRGKLAGNPTQVEKYGALIQQESARLKTLVEQVLQFASVSAGRALKESEALSVEKVIEEAVESSKAAFQEARTVVEKNIETPLPAVIGDPVALRHALQNLLSNAVKYGTNGDPWIGISAARAADGHTIEIRVADHGPGIPADEQAHVFDPFFRGKRAIEDQVHGTGLGLNLVKKIIEAHGGSVGVKSEPAKGTEFIVRLPAAPAGAST